MRISFSLPLKPESGKQNFAIRLAREFSKKGIKVVDRNPDVNLVFLKGVKKRCKNIFRLDGILMNTRINYKKKNGILHKEMKRCDGVIYQNEFCKMAADRFLGKWRRPHAVIPNGAHPKSFSKGIVRDKPYVLASCRWRPHKRLRATVEGFLASGLCSDFDLVVCGDPDYKFRHSSVVYTGKKSTKKVERIISSCAFAVHLAFNDWCPNSVVEALVAGKHVLHTDSGGTKYLVRDNGIMIRDGKWDFTAIDLYSPPGLDPEELSEGYQKMITLSRENYVRKDLHIGNVADQYIDFCKSVLNN